MTNKKGFTLIELLVVVLIIGILAAIALPMYTKTVEKSRFAEGMLLGKSVVNAADRFIMENDACLYNNGCTFAGLDVEVPFIETSGERAGYTKYFGISFNTGKASQNLIRLTRHNGIANINNSLYGLLFYMQQQPSGFEEYAGKIVCHNTASVNWCATLGAKACTIDGNDWLCLN